MLNVGSHSCCITPTMPSQLEGYLMKSREQNYTSVTDDLYVSALWLNQDGRSLLFISLELLAVRALFTSKIKQMITSQYDINPIAIIINATHTHCAPRSSIFSLDAQLDDERLYEKQVEISILNCVKKAYESQEPCDAFYRYGKINGIYGSRIDKEVQGDKQVYWIEFINHDFQVIGSILNISCHSTVLGPDELTINGDLIGRVAKKLSPNKYPIMTMGAAADMSTRYYRDKSDETTLEQLSDQLVTAIQNFLPRAKLELSAFKIKVIPYTCYYEAEQVAELNDLLYKKYQTLFSNETNPLLKKQYDAIATMIKIKQQTTALELNLDTTIIKMGELSFVCVPGELEASQGLLLKKDQAIICPIIITCANHYVGYIMRAKKDEDRYEVLTSFLSDQDVAGYIEKIEHYLK